MNWTWLHNIGYFLLGVFIVAGFCGFMYWAFYDIGLSFCKLMGWKQHGTEIFDYAIVTILGVFGTAIGCALIFLLWCLGKLFAELWQG